jgi:hypothetical protein
MSNPITCRRNVPEHAWQDEMVTPIETLEEGRRPQRRVPPTWATYAFCAAVIVLASTDSAGLPPGFSGGVLSLGLVPIVFIWQLFWVREHWRQYRWGGLLPAALCLACMPLAISAGTSLFEARLLFNRARYEAVAERVRDGTYLPPTDEVSLSRARFLAQWQPTPQGQRARDTVDGRNDAQDTVDGRNEWMHPEDRSLGSWARPVLGDNGKVVAVKFAVVSHPLGHLKGFIRVYEGGGWDHYRSPIAPGWYPIRF